jgi:hypothetical protein
LAAAGSLEGPPVKGTISVTADGKALPLPQFNPYVMQAAGYSISDGRLTVSTKVRFTPDGYDSKTNLQLDKLGVAGAEGDSLFLQKVGIPLQLALSLLRDPYGKIALGVPVKGGKGGTQVDVGSIVAQALVQAILGAVTSPLKLLGAAGGLLGGGGGAIAPEPIPCGPGRPTVEAAFPRESYAAGDVARLVIWTGGRKVSLQVFRAGTEEKRMRARDVMLGTPVTASREVGDVYKGLRISVGARPSAGASADADEWRRRRRSPTTPAPATARAERERRSRAKASMSRVAVGDPQVEREGGRRRCASASGRDPVARARGLGQRNVLSGGDPMTREA